MFWWRRETGMSFDHSETGAQALGVWARWPTPACRWHSPVTQWLSTAPRGDLSPTHSESQPTPPPTILLGAVLFLPFLMDLSLPLVRKESIFSELRNKWDHMLIIQARHQEKRQHYGPSETGTAKSPPAVSWEPRPPPWWTFSPSGQGSCLACLCPLCCSRQGLHVLSPHLPPLPGLLGNSVRSPRFYSQEGLTW